MEPIEYFIPGKPVPQGSKRWLPNGRMKEANTDLRPWRATVTDYTRKAIRGTEHDFPFAGPITVIVDFTFARPKSHYGTGRNAGKVKPNAPVYVQTTPDVDKLARAILDGITDSGLWIDDSQVVTMHVMKVYGEHPGASITLWAL